MSINRSELSVIRERPLDTEARTCQLRGALKSTQKCLPCIRGCLRGVLGSLHNMAGGFLCVSPCMLCCICEEGWCVLSRCDCAACYSCCTCCQRTACCADLLRDPARQCSCFFPHRTCRPNTRFPAINSSGCNNTMGVQYKVLNYQRNSLLYIPLKQISTANQQQYDKPRA